MTDPTALIGHWRLVSWTGVDAGGNEVAHGGAEPRGDLIYLPGGRMAVQIQYDDRPALGSRDLEAGDEPGKAAAYDTYNAYCGTWSLRGDAIVHHVELALHPDQPGMDKERPFELEGDELTLHTQPVATEDGEATSVLRWRRDQAP
jgi:hypothetical protein